MEGKDNEVLFQKEMESQLIVLKVYAAPVVILCVHVFVLTLGET